VDTNNFLDSIFGYTRLLVDRPVGVLARRVAVAHLFTASALLLGTPATPTAQMAGVAWLGHGLGFGRRQGRVFHAHAITLQNTRWRRHDAATPFRVAGCTAAVVVIVVVLFARHFYGVVVEREFYLMVQKAFGTQDCLWLLDLASNFFYCHFFA
jgi:hypothetical protein